MTDKKGINTSSKTKGNNETKENYDNGFQSKSLVKPITNDRYTGEELDSEDTEEPFYCSFCHGEISYGDMVCSKCKNTIDWERLGESDTEDTVEKESTEVEEEKSLKAKFCTNCGAEIAGAGKFCAECGMKVE